MTSARALTKKAAAQLDDQEEKKLFRRYCLYAWGLPLVIVIVAILLDFSGKLEMGYGSDEKREYCYLSPTGRIYFTAIPIGVLLLFNIVALVCTIAAIKTVQKATEKGNGYLPYPSLVVLCLKLTSVMGITWMLGFVYAASDNLYVEYIFVAINSLQGFFIFVCFGLNKQTREFYKNMFSCKKGEARYTRKLARRKDKAAETDV